MDRKDRVTLTQLVRSLDVQLPLIRDTSSFPHAKLDYLALLRLQTLLEQASDEHEEESRLASTSHARPKRGSLLDLDSRLSSAEQALAHLSDPASLSQLPRPFFPDPLFSSDLDFLRPSAPPPFDFPSETSTPDSPSPNERETPSIRRAALGLVEEKENERPALPVKAGDEAIGSTAFGLPSATGVRHRAGKAEAVPPYLAAKRKGKEKEREREKEEGDNATDFADEKKKDRLAAAADDLLPADSGTSATTSDLLSRHHALQSTLLDSLTSLSGALKSSTLTFSDSLAKDKEVMEKAKEQLEGNMGTMVGQQKRLKDVRGKTRGTTCWTIGLLAIVAVLWVLVFLLIKVT
ncbi:serine/arginine repetitive matrix 1 [Rhodotorula toruloides]|uniref:Serine/arginine repetitive matrix 1 n=1 Tax=Rhodotorula toruloides TaxID=5286 RepID=A0A511KCJ5_RHOTO|nr:serine/arginine repetitive matrix 1 [Rhodotorula toruloides]